jgi:predicted CoA-substrate-specific enzyme activase
MTLVAGIDIGSTATKVVLIESEQVVGEQVAPTGASSKRVAARLLAEALTQARRTPEDIAFVVTTGYGRRLLPYSDHAISEISANAAGARYLSRGSAAVRTIIDVGGQDSKVISLDDTGRMVNFKMNDKCAAGTGRFLEVMARVLELDIEELGPVSAKATQALPINSMCTVFAESEVVSLLAQDQPVADIVAGVHASIARRVATLARQIGVQPEVFFDGGPAMNPGLTAALERELGLKLIVPPRPQVATATGAAAIAQNMLAERGRGKGLSRADIAAR